MDENFEKLPWDTKGSYLEISLKRDKAFKLLLARFDKGSDNERPSNGLVGPIIPIKPTSPIVMGGGVFLE